MITVDPIYLALVVGTFLPIVVGIVTKQWASSALKATVLAVLAVLSGFGEQAILDDGSFSIEPLVVSILTTAAIAWASYYGFWKPTTVAPKVQDATANVGIGPREPQSHP